MLKISIVQNSLDEKGKSQNYFHCQEYLSLSVIAIKFYFVRSNSMDEKRNIKHNNIPMWYLFYIFY